MKSFATAPPKDFALLLTGAPGSGKSTFAGRFPKPHFLSLDHNLRGPCAQLASEGITDVTYVDDIDRGPDGLILPLSLQFPKFNAALVEGITSDRETIIIDNAVQLSDIFLMECLRQSPTKTGKPEIATWGQFFAFWKNFVLRIRTENRGKNIIVLAHEKLEKDDATGALKFFLAIPGQSGEVLPGLFTDVWRTEIAESYSPTGSLTHTRIVRVVQTPQREYMKTSIPSLPATFPVSKLPDILKFDMNSAARLHKECSVKVTEEVLDLSKLGTRLRRERRAVDISGREMARFLEVSAAFLSDCELGKRYLGMSRTQKFLEFCNAVVKKPTP